MADGALDRLDAPVRRLTGPETAIPFAPHLEQESVPSVARIAASIRELVGGA